MRAIVIGAGVGGLCAAIRLATAGHDVVVLERNPVAGGKLATLTEAGYTFDVGPTLLTLPQYLDDVLRPAGTTLADEVELVRLDPQCRYRWPNGTTLDIPDDRAATPTAVDRFSPGAGEAWSGFQRHVARIWEVSERTFLAGPMSSPVSLLGRMRSPLDLPRVDGARTLAKLASATFDDPRLRQLVGRYATYSGSSPYRAPATLACISHVEQQHGCWHVLGGIGRIRDTLERVARSVGVDVRLGVDVGRVTTDGRRVTGVHLADGGAERADVVVSNVDAAHLYTDLLPDPEQARRLDKIDRSTSAFVICAAVRGRTEGIAHHNVFFSLHDEQEFRYLTAGQLPIDPTVYACVPSTTDRSMAPRSGESWVLLVNTPHSIGIDRKLMTAAVLNRLAERGLDLRERIEFTRTLVPADFDARYRAHGGAIYGTSSNGRRAAFSRPGNIGPVDGLYLVGGSTHPGGGLPMVATSARIVAEIVAERHG
jgi:phytoene desaturase